MATAAANVFQRTVDYPEDLALGYLVLDDGTWVMVRQDQVEQRSDRR